MDEDAFNEERFAYNDIDSNLVDPLNETSVGYFGSIKSILFDEKMNTRYKGKIVYTAMHGVGADFVDEAFEASGFRNTIIHVKEQRGKSKTKSLLYCFPVRLSYHTDKVHF